MKMKFVYVLGLVILASCSAPRYSYHFDHYNYNAGKKKSVSEVPANLPDVMSVNPEVLTASAEPTASAIEMKTDVAPAAKERKTYLQMNKSERKQLKKQIKADIKNYLKEKKEIKAQKASGMDRDLKLAAIFGAVGLVGLIIGGDVFYIIGGIALIIGVVFFVKWLIRQ